MGLKTFDIAPEEFKDGGVATADKEHWTSNEEAPTDAEKAIAAMSNAINEIAPISSLISCPLIYE